MQNAVKQKLNNWSVSSSRDEMNLAEFPLALLSTRANPKVKTLEFSDQHRAPSGELVERKWIITGADKFGLPTATDDDVVLGLMRLSMAQGFRQRKVYFTRYELLKTLRWSTEGRSYRRLIKSLDRLSGVRIRSTNSFYDNEKKAYQTCNFGIIDAYEINNEHGKKRGSAGDSAGDSAGEPTTSFFIWSEMLFDSFKAGYIKKLDLDLYFSLKSSISRRLYRYFDKHFYYKSTIERAVMSFAFEKLGLSRSYKYLSSVKQQLEPALEELKSVGFLSSYEFYGRGEAAKLRVVSGSGLGAGLGSGGSARSGVNSSGGALTEKYVEELTSRGIAPVQAQRLISAQTEKNLARLPEILKYYDHLVATNDYKVSKNKVGFLYRAVQRAEQFQIPDSISTEGRSAKRADLKLYKSAGRHGMRERKASRDDNLFQTALSSLNADQIQRIYRDVEEKMQCLKSVLDEERYREAIEGCVKKEILSRAN